LKDNRKAGWILFGIAALECGWVALNLGLSGPAKFFHYLGFTPFVGGTLAGWCLAAIVTALFVPFAARLPSVRANLVRISWLKILALGVAIGAGILEEVIFRRCVMNYLQDQRHCGIVLQILASGFLFGAAHGIWGIMGGSLRAAIGATVATGLLGIALAIVFVVSGRVLAPCIAAHFLINLLAEPGLVLAAVRGEMQQNAFVR
jgi:membrane protease YdiL (CAAX protease family)